MQNNDFKKILITTAIDYTNDVIHIGHAYQKILADSIARFYRLKMQKDKVFFVTGTDEFGATCQKASVKANMSEIDFVTDISNKDKFQLDTLQISYDRFIRTTDLDHKKFVQQFYMKCFNNKDIYKDTYEGLYCEGCEAYKTLSELNSNNQCVLHPLRTIQKIREENYFFSWSKYSNFLLELLKKPNFVLPLGKLNEMVAFVKNGLKDIPISRPKKNVSWGITVPNDDSHVIYVWFDALVNYYTASCELGFWNDETKIVHILGKDNARWHALLWPAMLKSCGYKVPDTIYVHGFMNINGQKISKSLGNVILPSDLVDNFSVDAVRYYLLKHGPITEDVDISVEHLRQVYNADLANGLGNTVSRISKVAEKSEIDFDLQNFKFQDNFDQFNHNIFNSSIFEPLINNYRVDITLQNIWNELSNLDKHINNTKPWEITDKNKLKDILTYQVKEIIKIANLIEPFMPSTSSKIKNQFCSSKITFLEPLFKRL